MNKKEIIIIHKYIDGEEKCILDNNSYDNLMLAIKTYEKENKKYDKELKKCKKRIDKAIEYIKKYADKNFTCGEDTETWNNEFKELLNILKGEE